MKTQFLILVLFFVLLSKAQTVLQSNKNPNMKYFQAWLNKDKDTIYFKSDYVIDHVEIFNTCLGYNKEIYFNEKHVKVSIRDVPCGRFVVGTSTNRILMLLSLNRQ